ncbi:unnamed protein product [Paramecium primaurelia]|uniref:Uncharacterized protein n=1 Tax=Paramecium primaurelia TaxID=5886 RepID=A0A8S1MJV7_PARPR|nr:unnamed protein product [Paramecium primaurelia]CAD8087389.1 unnamed protein product [Paramecium primaurelia]
MGLIEKIKEIEEEMARTQKNKATEYHMGQLKAKLAKYRTQLLEPPKSGPKGEGFEVQKFGNARVCMIGFPSVGKSTILSTLTKTQSLVAAYEFTTLTCIPGVIDYKDAKIQLLDLPGIIEGASEGRGRGRQVIAVAKACDLVLMVLEADKAEDQRRKLTLELDKMGIRLNRKKPDVTITPNKSGMVRITSTIKLTKVDEKLIKNIMQEYKIHNVDILIREDITVDDLIDIIEGNRKYVKCLYVFNKIDKISIEEVDEIARRKDHCVISCNLKLNLDYLLECMWEKLDLVRVYTKKRGQQPDFGDPIVLSNDRNGLMIRSVCAQIHRELVDEFKFAIVWGRSCKFNPQKVGLNHVLADEDVLQIYKSKTKAQLAKQNKQIKGTKHDRKKEEKGDKSSKK